MPAEDDGEYAQQVSTTAEGAGVNAVAVKVARVAQDKQDAPKVDSEADEFGLPVRPARRRRWSEEEAEAEHANGGPGQMAESEVFEDAPETPAEDVKQAVASGYKPHSTTDGAEAVESPAESPAAVVDTQSSAPDKTNTIHGDSVDKPLPERPLPDRPQSEELLDNKVNRTEGQTTQPSTEATNKAQPDTIDTGLQDAADRPLAGPSTSGRNRSGTSSSHGQSPVALRQHANSVSEWSHQKMATPGIDEEEEKAEEEWQEMPAYATHRIYDDWGKVLAKEYDEDADEHLTYSTLGGAGKGYTRVQIDDDAESATSMDDNTAYLFKDPVVGNTVFDEDEEGKDLLSQMRATKELLTEGQRIAYVGLIRLSIGKILDGLNELEKTKGTKKQIEFATEATKMWGQKMMVRLYSHMEIDSAEQIMVEQLAEHGVLPGDLTPALMQNARVKNPANVESETSSVKSANSARPSMSSPRPSSTFEKRQSTQNLSVPGTPSLPDPPPAYEEHTADELTVRDPAEFEGSKNIDIDIRWTVLCDLFLLLVADSTYDARSRTLLELVGEALSVGWQEICRFEKRVTDALEMQEQADKENWNEEEHLDARKKQARNKRLMVMGLCTVGGGLVIGLSAGLAAPFIGAGLAAGFATIGVSGTGTFLGGAGAAALIGGGGALTGSIVGGRASDRRTGSVKTFEYRPLFNNKRTNLIVTVSGWMTGNVDDVRLPFSTVDPIMGDIYSVNWEPDMLRSTGQTIQILATEALTQTIQQVLASTLLTGLMAGLSLPIILTKLSYLIDNPWTVSLARADATGLILADSLIDRNLGVRPITLVGFSLGSRVIFSCLRELAKRGALGLVQNVYLFGSPIVAKKEEYLRARTVVSGRFLNGYASNDWILGYLFRATNGGIGRVSGLASIDVPGIENKDVTELVPGHMAYRGMMPTLLSEVGWAVDGLEFNEIEDPDPENHEKRQRELLNEIEAARRELDEREKDGGGKKASGFKSFFSRKKAVKKEWETYDERSQKVLEGDTAESERVAQENANVMFDVDAIRAEALKLALEGGDIEDIKRHLQVREIESTLPALKVESVARPDISPPAYGSVAPKEVLRQTKSYDGTAAASSSRPQSTGAYSNGHVTEEEVKMSFDDSEQRPVGSKNASRHSLAPEPVPRHSTPERPALQSAKTSPAIASSATFAAPAPAAPIKNPSHNPWADEEEGFGGEKEVQMSFE